MSMDQNTESAAIVNAILHLGASLNLPVTAEGVETQATSDALQVLGCSDGQGWLFGRPIPQSLLAEKLGVIHDIASPGISQGESNRSPDMIQPLHERRDFLRRGSRQRAA